jgi:hypothetical protein
MPAPLSRFGSRRGRGNRRPPGQTGRSEWCALGVLLGVAAAGVLIADPLLARRAARRTPPVAEVRFDWPLLPAPPGAAARTWVPADVRQGLVEQVRDALEVSAGQPDARALAAAGTRLADSGWFERVQSVRSIGRGVVLVEAVWHVPAAVVRDGERDRLISARGVLMPVDYPAGQAPLPAIVGAAAAPPRAGSGTLAVGAPWSGEDVRGALSLLALLAPEPWRVHVREIDVAGFGEAREMALVTRAGTRIVWGGPPEAFTPGQVDSASRLQRLRALFSGPDPLIARLDSVDLSGPVLLAARRRDQP